MITTDATIKTNHDLWAAALTLPDQPDLHTSLVAELAEYLGQPAASVAERCRNAAAAVAQSWREAAPATPEAISAFYRQTDGYLFDLTWWHTLREDASALVQAEALQTALTQRACTVLDFGSGIGSLGLLMAQHGLAVTLADINPHLNAYARWRFERRGLSVQWIDMPQNTRTGSSLPAERFDFISAVDVLEHLPDPEAALAELSRALRPGGTLFIHLPPAPDSAHPMHLWHDPRLLLRQLHRHSLWLARCAEATLVLRRGTGPRYALQPGLSLVADADGGIVLSTHPLLALRLNAQAFRLLTCLDPVGTANDVSARVPNASLVDVTAFLDSLAQRRLLLKQMPPPLYWPRVSIIVPAHGRPAATRDCVVSLLVQNYPPDKLEVIVVDDASDPPLAPALEGLPVRLLRQEANIGQSAARNLAAALVQSELLAFIDNDCVADPDWLRTLVIDFDDPAVKIAGGRVVSPPPAGPVAAFEAVRSPLDMGALGGAVGPTEAVAYLPACNLVVRRAAMLQVRGFDAAMVLGEDVDFIWRVLGEGGQARYIPDGRVIHHHRVQLGALLRRRMDYASSEADLQRRHPAGRRVMALPLTVLTVLAAVMLWTISVPLALLAGLLAISSVFVEIANKRRRLQQNRVRLPLRRIAWATLIAHGASLYHLSANITRYYSLPLLVLGLFWPPLLWGTLALILVPPLVEHQRRRPQVALVVFVALYWIEMAAYQIGVWRGCFKWRTLRPFLPRLRLGR
jgi:mycofactocin system glycosyltransferase